MSYQTELQRLVEAKASMRQSIINKGVEVPEDVMIEDLPEYIAQIQGATGPEVDGTDWGTLYTTAYPDGLVLNSEADYNGLCLGTASNLTINGLSIGKNTITGYTFGKNCTTIGQYFLYRCENFNSDITVPSTITSISTGFLGLGVNFTGLLTVNTTAVPSTPDYNTLVAKSASAAMYKDGIRITGPGAAAWKEALPDRDNPYRKLILVEA